MSSRIRFYDGREWQIGETLYFPERTHKSFRVIVIRALKPGMEDALFDHQDNYDYFSWITTIGEHRMIEIQFRSQALSLQRGALLVGTHKKYAVWIYIILESIVLRGRSLIIEYYGYQLLLLPRKSLGDGPLFSLLC